MQTNDMDEISMQKPYAEFYLAMPTLEELSSYAIAVELWRAETKQKDPNSKLNVTQDCNFDNNPRKDKETKEKLSKELPTWVPSKILDIIESCLQVVECETYRWSTYYHREVAIRDLTFCDLMYCIWLPNGLIDEYNTALNMLSNPSRSIHDKFKIMCIFCLEDEIKKLSLGAISNHHYNELSVFGTINIVNYWISFMKRFKALPMSVPNVENEFWQIDWQPPLDLLTWVRLGYEYDTTAYISLLKALLETSAYRVKQIEYIVELWRCSPDRFKRRSRRAPCVCKKVFQMHANWKRKNYRKPCPKDFEFLWIFLSSGNARFKKNFLYMQQLSILFMDFSTIDRLFDMCLQNVAEFNEYKRFLTNSNGLAQPFEIDVQPYTTRNASEAVARFVARYFPEHKDRDRLNLISKFISALVFDSEAEVERQVLHSYLKAGQLIEKNNEIQPYRFRS